MANALPLLLLGAAAILLLRKKKNGEDEERVPEIEDEPDIPGVDDDDLSDEERCDKFLTQIYVEVTEEDEMPIAEIAVTEQILPMLQSFAQNVIKEKGIVDTEEYPRYMAHLALEQVIPVCEWTISTEGELISPDDERARKIYNSLIILARQVATEANASVGISQPEFTQAEPKQAGFEKKD